ncbi:MULTISPECIES: helix-turn-helix domain-containing protein [Heyndrickxia]|uniref:helix-turn-helix domain-containing protein n=1 Tax=Heyndrickxia TaxID=2837504 RepID=UPI002DBE05A0|nr:helix-turn-helix domain-containing protein [Weizmannia sp. CD-2023]MEC2221926.1 helix-turn-helix domain-containing protein [Weizmannia sp. CD-2023]
MREFETFNTLSELNKHVQFVLENVDLLERERSVFMLLSRYSVKFLGVSFLKVDTMAEILNVHKRTVQRALKGLEQKGIIKRLKRIRIKSGGFSSSLTLINSHVDVSPRQDDKKADSVRFYDDKTAKETISSLSKNNFVNNNDSSSYIENRVPAWFLNITKPFFDNHVILKMWYKVNKAFEVYSSIPYNVDEELTHKAVKSVIYSYKHRKIRGSLFGYLWATMRNAIYDIESELAAQRRREAIANGNVQFFNWLEK